MQYEKCSSPGLPFGRLLFSSGIYAFAGFPGEAGPPSPSPLALIALGRAYSGRPVSSRQSRPRLRRRLLVASFVPATLERF